MRLVSQNGKFDVPYEITSLSRTENIIRVYVPMVGEKKEQSWLVIRQMKKPRKP